MKSFSKFLIQILLFILLAAGLATYESPPPAHAQNGDPSIDDVINQLDQDFTFGGKEEIKRNNLQNANEQNREDIKIREEDERLQQAGGTQTTVQFSLTDLNAGFGDDIDFSIAGTSLAVALDDVTVTPSINLPSGSNQTLSVTCNAASTTDCSFDATILSGATFGSPIFGVSTGIFVLGIGFTANFNVIVS